MQPPTIFTARRNDIVVEAVIDEVLIYDQRADVAHCLGDIAALVWRTCDGGATLGDVAEQLVAHDLAGSGEDATELAGTAVSELVEKGLLETSRVGAGAVSRRQALRRMAGVGAAAVVAPLVVSAAVPSAAAAVSTSCSSIFGTTCTTNTQCCSSAGLQCGGTAITGECCYVAATHVGTANCSQCCSKACSGSSGNCHNS